MLMTAACSARRWDPEAALERAREEERHKIRKRKSRTELKTTLGFDFTCKIILDSLQAHPYGMVVGTLIVENNIEKAHEGIRVQLEAVVTLAETTFKCGVRDVKEFECSILAGVKDLGLSKINSFFFSPVGAQILGKSFDDVEPEKEYFTLKEGTSTFPFSFPMSYEPLPVPFKKRQASLEFRVSAYLKDSIYFFKMDSVTVDYPGYRSLYTHVPEPLCQGSIVQTSTKGSLFGKKSKLIMKTNDSKFLPGEDIAFSLLLLSKASLTVKEVKVSLVRQILFNIDGVRRVGSMCICKIESNDMINDNGTLTFSGKLNVPRGCAPTYTENEAYHMCYHIEWEVKVAECSSVMKGKAAVTIGTTRESTETVQFYDFADFQNCIGIRISSGLIRTSSIESRLSDCSLYSLPPAYSQLSSRTASLTSLETLPPRYEDLN